jgi:hypothetical protein
MKLTASAVARRASAVSLLLLASLSTGLAPAQTLSVPEKQKIEALIKQVSELKDANFIRNGWSYSADNAATFLRRKWQANDSSVKTARDFVDKVASFSGTSGKPYLIRFKDGKEIGSREYLLGELVNIDSAEKPSAHSSRAS